jgi:hypothetical protein
LFLSSQKESIKLVNFSFLTAQKLTPQINRLADGAIALKLDKNYTNIFFLKLISPT